MLDNNVGITVDENLKRSKVLEEFAKNETK